MEIERLKANNLAKIGNRSNNNGGIHKCENMLNILSNFDENTVITVENCWKDFIIRDFALTNAGSVIECLINATLDKEKRGEYEKQWKDENPDALNGFMKWEIKACLDSHFKCTPAKGDKATLLVNCDGVSLIRKADVLGIVDKNGRLPSSGLYGNRENFMVKWLSSLLGFDE